MSATTRAIVIGKDSEKLILAATEREIQQYALDQTVSILTRERRAEVARALRARNLVGRPRIDPAVNLQKLVEDGRLYDAEGRVVAGIEEFSVDRDRIETTTFGDTNRTYVPGMMTIYITAVGVAV